MKDGFQSTLSVRRATKRYWMVSRKKRFQSTLSVRRATLTSQIRHANNEFQSTLSVRSATNDIRLGQSPIGISIHALRKESDALRRPHRMGQDISIHALRKESDRAAGHFCPLSETQASCLALSISNNTTGATNNMPKTSSCLSVSF